MEVAAQLRPERRERWRGKREEEWKERRERWSGKREERKKRSGKREEREVEGKERKALTLDQVLFSRTSSDKTLVILILTSRREADRAHSDFRLEMARAHVSFPNPGQTELYPVPIAHPLIHQRQTPKLCHFPPVQELLKETENRRDQSHATHLTRRQLAAILLAQCTVYML